MNEGKTLRASWGGGGGGKLLPLQVSPLSVPQQVKGQPAAPSLTLLNLLQPSGASLNNSEYACNSKPHFMHN